MIAIVSEPSKEIQLESEEWKQNVQTKIERKKSQKCLSDDRIWVVSWRIKGLNRIWLVSSMK